MKKFLSMVFGGLMLLATSVSAQETVVFSENLDTLADGTGYSGSLIGKACDISKFLPGWHSWKLYQCMGSAKLGTASEGGHIRTCPIDLSANNGNFIVRFKAMAWKGDNTSMKVVIMHADMTSDTAIVSGLDNVSANETTSKFLPFEVYCAKGDTATKIQFMGYADKNSRIFIDDIEISTFSGTSISFNPSELTFDNVLIGSTVSGKVFAQGYNLDEDSYPVAISNPKFTTTISNITKADLTNGINITITYDAQEVAHDTAILSIGTYNARIIGNCIDYVEANTIKELRDQISLAEKDSNLVDPRFFKYTGSALITSFGANKYGYKMMTIQDTTGALYVFDKEGTYISNLGKGELITNIIGNMANYFGLCQMLPTADIEVEDPYADEDMFEPVEVTFEQMLDDDYMQNLQSALVNIKGNFTVSGNFMVDKHYRISNGSTTDSLVYTYYADADYIGNQISNKLESINGVIYRSMGKYYVIPRNTGDFMQIGGSVGIDEISNGANVNIYPNPVINELHFDGINATEVEIYNMLGDKIATYKNVNNVVPMSNLTKGTYIVRFIANEGNAVKKVVK